MAENALDTLSLALALSGAGMPRTQAEAVVCAAGQLVAGSGRHPPDFFDALYRAGPAPTLAEAFATLLAKRDLPNAGTIVDTFSPYRELEAAGIPFQLVLIIARILYRLRNWNLHAIPHIEVIADMFEASGFDPDGVHGFAAALKALAVWRAA